jgi:hypothetical protein
VQWFFALLTTDAFDDWVLFLRSAIASEARHFSYYQQTLRAHLKPEIKRSKISKLKFLGMLRRISELIGEARDVESLPKFFRKSGGKDSRTPKPDGNCLHPRVSRSVLECGCLFCCFSTNCDESKCVKIFRTLNEDVPRRVR